MPRNEPSNISLTDVDTELPIGEDDFEAASEPGPEEDQEGTVTEDGSTQYPIPSGGG